MSLPAGYTTGTVANGSITGQRRQGHVLIPVEGSQDSWQTWCRGTPATPGPVESSAQMALCRSCYALLRAQRRALHG